MIDARFVLAVVMLDAWCLMLDTFSCKNRPSIEVLDGLLLRQWFIYISVDHFPSQSTSFSSTIIFILHCLLWTLAVCFANLISMMYISKPISHLFYVLSYICLPFHHSFFTSCTAFVRNLSKYILKISVRDFLAHIELFLQLNDRNNQTYVLENFYNHSG